MNVPKRGRVLKAARIERGIAVPWGGRETAAVEGGREAKARESAPATAGDRAAGEPQLEILRADGNIEAIQVSCACGRVHRLELIEPTTSNGENRSAGNAGKEGEA